MNEINIFIKFENKNKIRKLNIKVTTKILLKYIPVKYLKGIESIYYIDINYYNKYLGKFYKDDNLYNKKTLGLYFPLKENKARLIILLDNLIEQYSSRLMEIFFFRTLFISKPLFHEIGHHMHRTIITDNRDKEIVANLYEIELRNIFFHKRYLFLEICLYPFFLFYKYSKLLQSKTRVLSARK